MPSVETVNGPIDVEELGRTLIHEHFRTTDEATRVQFPHLYDEQAEWVVAIADANAVKGHGIRTVVEPSAMFLNRDAEFSKRVADESGLQVVLATGIYTYDHLPQSLLNRNEDQLADIFVHEIEHGIQGTGIRPAFIKCAADEPGLTPNVEKVHRAAARASNVPASRSWPTPARPAEPDTSRCASSPRRESTPPRSRWPTPATRMSSTTSRSCSRPAASSASTATGSTSSCRPSSARRTTLALLERGYAERMFLSQDYCSSIDWFPREVQDYLKANEVPDWSMTFLFEKIIPELRGARDDRRPARPDDGREPEALARILKAPAGVV